MIIHAHPNLNAWMSDYIPHQNMLVIIYPMPNLNFALTDIIVIADELLSLYLFICLFMNIFINIKDNFIWFTLICV